MEITKLCSRKFRKPSDGERENVDRLSSLPDDILIHILSFLPTKIYVATSILGRRWRFLWAHVPNLDFDDEDLHRGGDDDERVSSIINRVMFLHKRQNINTFRFCHFEQVECSDYEFEKWIITAIECNVQELDLSLAFELRLPLCIFTCKTLVNLSLAYLEMPTIGTVYLPALKKLQLDLVHDDSVESLSHLLSGCPVLDELLINIASGNNKICISSNTINRLELEIDYDMLSYSQRKVRLKLDTPALEYLKFKNNYVPQNYSKGFAFFASAEMFHNLTDIELEADWGSIRRFLERADNLEVLTIRSCYCNDNPIYWIDPKQVPACLVLHLGTVRIRDFGCEEQDFKVVRYILKNAKVLKRMEIYADDIDSNKQLEAVKRITLFERGSDACQLAFH